MFYRFHKISINCDGSYVTSPKKSANKKVTKNPKNDDDKKCVQYAIISVFNHKRTCRDPRKITKIRLFIGLYVRKDVYFSSRLKNGENFEANKKSIAVNV